VYTFESILYLSFWAFFGSIIAHYFILEHIHEANLYLRAYGKVAFFYFAWALMVSPVLHFIKKQFYRDRFILLRKIFGILACIFFLKHGLEYFASEYIYYFQWNYDVSYLEYAYSNILQWNDALSGIVAGILLWLLGITSNKVSLSLLWWKKWKVIQSLVYPAFLISALHIAFASRFDSFYSFLIILVVSLRTVAYFSVQKNVKKWKTIKYLCVPCGYIYDENIWDPDSGIAPWTKFEDIPDTWRCPICGVTKADFIPYYEEETNVFWWYIWEVVSHTLLTQDVLELSLRVESNIKILPGQYAILVLEDFDGTFKRAYSVVEYKNNTLTFAIKLDSTWRWGKALTNLQVWEIVKMQGVYGEFILQNTLHPKVFIATGTWLSPIMNMLVHSESSCKKHVFFWVRERKDLFYIEKLKSIPELELHVYLSKEKSNIYEFWRIDVTGYAFSHDTEFYICGNPDMVTSISESLISLGYKRIYTEKF
jgi:ferredoxin-NADP reductase/rubredoxin